MPIDPAFLTSGVEWQIPSATAEEAEPAGGGFGSMLSNAISGLTAAQVEAADGARALAAGQVEDPTAVVMAVERARLAMQLAGQIRTKSVEAINDIFHTQV
jgi:flagellar hook-basal body complex protein FliE